MKANKILDEQGKKKKLDITQYLGLIAGFVEFPIIINENDRKTIIIHPKYRLTTLRDNIPDIAHYYIQKLSLTYPWNKAIYPQDIGIAKEFLKEVIFDVKEDLDLEGFEGIISFLVPISSNIDSSIMVTPQFFNVGKYDERKTIRYVESWEHDFSYRDIHLSRSSKKKKNFAIFRQGVLLSETEPPFFLSRHVSRELSGPFSLINIPIRKDDKINVARTSIERSTKSWDVILVEKIFNYIMDKNFDYVNKLSDSERFYQIGRFMEIYQLFPLDIILSKYSNLLSIPLLEKDGHLNFINYKNLSTKEIQTVPEPLKDEVTKHYFSKFLAKREYEGFLKYWQGNGYISIETEKYGYGCSAGINSATQIIELAIKHSHHLTSIEFIEPPYQQFPPMVQKKYIPNKGRSVEIKNPRIFQRLFNKYGVLSVAKKAREYPERLSLDEKRYLIHFISIPALSKINMRFPFKDVTIFSEPYENLFAYGDEFLNANHRITLKLIQLIGSIVTNQNIQPIDEESLGKINDVINNLNDFQSLNNFTDNFTKLWTLSKELNLLYVEPLSEFIPSKDDFIPKTFAKDPFSSLKEIPKDEPINPLFGKIIKSL